MIKKYKKIIIGLLALWILFCLVYGGMLWREMLIFNRGSELMSQGDYASAKLEFEKIGETEKIAQCDSELKRAAAYAAALERLERARAYMEEGKLEEAKAELVILGDFEDAPELVTECEYRMALKLRDEGELTEALLKAQKLGEHAGALELAAELREEIYQQALSLAYECKIDEAMALFEKLLDYRDSQMLYLRCSERKANLQSEWAEPVKYSDYAGLDVGSGRLYWHRIGLVYVPHEAGAETTGMIFYPGGYDQSLANGYMTDYLYGYYGELPNAIMVFCYANGFGGSYAEKAEDSYKVLEQAAMENNVFVHDVAMIGASNGAYTAAHAAVWFYEEKGIEVKKVLTLDAGQHWESFMPVLSTEECDVMAQTGTKFLLVEGDGVGMNKLAIQTMVAHKMDVTIAHVENYGHYSVIYDAMKYGLFNWAAGASELPEHENYKYIPLDKNSTYPN